jgi:restriction system protein
MGMEESPRQRNATNRTHGTDRPQEPRIILPHGGYENLKSYQAATIIFDATNAFCDRFINPRSRTYDQMVQAARS